MIVRRAALVLFAFALASSGFAGTPTAVSTDPLSAGQSITLPIEGDLVIAETAGRSAHVKAIYRAVSSNRSANREYELPPHEQRIVRFSDVLRDLGPIEATVEVSGQGRVVFTIPAVAESTAPTTAIRDVSVSPFKASPLADPDTGLIYMRDRWYDPTAAPTRRGDSAAALHCRVRIRPAHFSFP